MTLAKQNPSTTSPRGGQKAAKYSIQKVKRRSITSRHTKCKSLKRCNISTHPSFIHSKMPSKPNKAPLAIGIDLGSQNARIALTKSNDKNTNDSPHVNVQVVSNQQGQRHTLAYCHVDNNTNSILYGMDCKKWCEREKKDLKNVIVRSMLCEAKARSAFFQHLCELARDASSDADALLFPVVSLPIIDETNNNNNNNDEDDNEEYNALVDALKRSILHGFCGSPDNSNTHFCLLTDPAAICIAHGLTDANSNSKSNWKTSLVIDWGASGLKCSMVQNVGRSGMLEVTRTATNCDLNGRKMTSVLVQHCASMFERKTRCPGILDSKKAVSKLHTACESAFKTLSRANTATIMCDGVYEGMDLNVPLSRPRLEMLCSAAIKSARGFITEFCGGSNNDIDVVLAAGNVCEMPAVKALISSLFPNVNNRGNASIALDEAVVVGCAMHAGWMVQNGMHKVQKTNYATSEDVTQFCPFDVSTVVLDDADSDSSSPSTVPSAAVSLIQMGAPLPAHVVKSIDLNTASPCSALMVKQILRADNSSIDLAKIGISEEQRSKKFVELSVTLSLDGRLTICVDGGKETCISG